MKARNELNMHLYSQKANGYEQCGTPEKNDYLSVIQGDVNNVKTQLEISELSLLNGKREFSDNQIKNMIYNFIFMSGDIARTAISAGMSDDEAYALTDIYVRKAVKCLSIEQLNEAFSDLCLDFTQRINEIIADTSASPHIRKCKKYIYQNLNGDLSVKSLAGLIGLNPSYLSKLFSKEVGIPIKKFVTQARIDTAQNLLRYTNLTYIEIAYSLGFTSQSSFIRTFKGATGTTPKKYREKF